MQDQSEPSEQKQVGRRVGLFVTCLVDLMRPSVGFAAVRLLEAAGFDVEVPAGQTCCGQPAYNSGDFDTARDLARGVVEAFAGYDYVVAPSASCAGMLKLHVPKLLADDSALQPAAEAFAARVFELTQFLVRFAPDAERNAVPYRGRVTYHDACSAQREMAVRDEPRRLLAGIEGLELVELSEPEACCGFGGTFCVKYPDISNAMVSRKVADIEATGAALVTSGDLGCLMNIAGRLSRNGSRVEVRHIAELLAGMSETPPIGKAKG